MITHNVVFVLLFSGLALCANPLPISKDNMDFSHWNNVVSKLVKVNDTIQGVNLNSFDYAGLAGDWDYVNFTYQVKYADTRGFTETQFKAFWINVYNYLAITLVYSNPCAIDLFGKCRPLESIREIDTEQPSALTTIWTKKALNLTVMNQTLSLDDIEGQLRAPPNGWKEDPRVHACIVCASVSCPNLRNEAYVVERLDDQMRDNTLNFLSNTLKGASIEGDSIRISRIFDFFPEDFNNQTGTKANKTSSISIVWFLEHWGPEKISSWLKDNPNPVIYYFTYNWDLNGSVGTLCNVDRLCFPWWAFIVIGVSIVLFSALVVLIYRKGKRSDYEAVN